MQGWDLPWLGLAGRTNICGEVEVKQLCAATQSEQPGVHLVVGRQRWVSRKARTVLLSVVNEAGLATDSHF